MIPFLSLDVSEYHIFKYGITLFDGRITLGNVDFLGYEISSKLRGCLTFVRMIFFFPPFIGNENKRKLDCPFLFSFLLISLVLNLH